MSLITASCAKISALSFPQPGIFTNAIITKPEVTSLIRDALAPELSLYRITRSFGLNGVTSRYGGNGSAGHDDEMFAELRPERIDGKSIYIEHSFADGPSPAVRVPYLASQQSPKADLGDADLSSPTKRRIASQYKLIPASVIDSEDVNEICAAVATVVEQYPTMNNGSSVKASLANLQKEYNELILETDQLEQKVADQRAQLDIYNDSLNELLPRRGIVSTEKEIDIVDMIAREEREIESLEEELTRRQRV